MTDNSTTFDFRNLIIDEIHDEMETILLEQLQLLADKRRASGSFLGCQHPAADFSYICDTCFRTIDEAVLPDYGYDVTGYGTEHDGADPDARDARDPEHPDERGTESLINARLQALADSYAQQTREANRELEEAFPAGEPNMREVSAPHDWQVVARFAQFLHSADLRTAQRYASRLADQHAVTLDLDECVVYSVSTMRRGSAQFCVVYEIRFSVEDEYGMDGAISAAHDVAEYMGEKLTKQDGNKSVVIVERVFPVEPQRSVLP